MLRKVFCLCAILVILPTFTASATTELSSFSVFATNSVWVRQGSDVNSGNIGVADASPGPWLDSQSEVSVGKSVYVADGVSIYGDSIKVKTGASAFDVYYNELTNNGTIRGSEYTPLVLPLDITMPTFPTPAPGTEDHDIPQGGNLTLDAGSYGEIMVRKNATLTLTGGTYHFENLDLGDLNAKVLFQTPTDLIINNRLEPGKSAVIGPDVGSGISAKDIRIYVNGINGGTGNLGATPKAAQIGYTNTLRANIYAPNGTVLIKQGTVAEGAFIGKDVKIGMNVQVTLNSGIGGPGPDEDLDGDGFTENQGDCDDNDASINPDAVEVCDDVDNNCDGQIDEGVQTIFYEDTDGDGFGNTGVTTEACQQPSGYVTDNTDCNDSDPNIHPGATETPYDGIDQDCDGSDLVDVDGDTYVAEQVGGDDCNDNDATINPGAIDIPENGIDEDCDGQDAVDPNNDNDGDGYTENQGDCDDADPAVNPEATEEPYNDKDDDCNPATPDDDLDGDGYGIADDCSDNDDTINPGVQEVCDGVDNNCDGQIDEPVILFISPVDDSTINLSSTLVTGTINTCSQEVGILVNGVLAMVAGNEFAVNDVPLEIGVNTLTAVATDEDGKTATDTITVYTNVYQDQVNLSANITSGISPLDVEFSIDTQISNPIVTYEMDFEGDGVIDQTIVDPDNVPFTYVQEGLYYPTITVTDDQGYWYTDTIAINVLSLNELNTLLTNIRIEVINLLNVQDIQGALPYIVESSRAKYEEIFTLLIDQLPDIFSVPEEFNLISVINNVATYESVVVDDDGVTRSYPVVLVKDVNGLWKISTF